MLWCPVHEGRHRRLPGAAAGPDPDGKAGSLDRPGVERRRFLFGVGGGWNLGKMENHGTEFKTRFKLMRERIEAMKEIWSSPKPNITARWSILRG